MNILKVNQQAISDIYTIEIGKYQDERGYFSETYRKSALKSHSDIPNSLKKSNFAQMNQSFSKANTFRGLHLNTVAPQGKLVRCINGRLLDIILDVNPKSETFRKIIIVDLKEDNTKNSLTWIWIPPGYAHGTLLTEDSIVEYYCSCDWQKEGDRSYSIFSENIDWSLCDKTLLEEAMKYIKSDKLIISEKDESAIKKI